MVRSGGPGVWQARPVHLFADLAWRGLVHQVTDPTLAAELDGGQLTAYAGFDPSADSLGFGNLLPVVTLMRLQRAGHRPVALAGGGTGLVGDPGGKTEERALAPVEVIEANVAAVRAQLGRFLDFGAGAGAAQAVLVDNRDWLGHLGLLDFLRDVGKHVTVNTMIARESVRARLEERERGISYAEFSYMLLQAYDFLHLYDTLGCRLQIGGGDQWGNIVAGADLIHRLRPAAKVFGLTSPLVLKADGTKLGKTEAGNVWLDAGRTSPYRLYQFLVRADDAMVGAYLRAYTFLSRPEIDELDRLTAEHAERRQAQRALAWEVATLVHGEAEAARARDASEVLFSEDVRSLDEATLLDVFSEAPATRRPVTDLDGAGVPLIDVLVATDVATSRSDARRAVAQGGVYVNNRRVPDAEARLAAGDTLHGRYLLLRRGKKDHHLVRFE
ncbi:MAG: tyrosine--tRNA ligase [Acidimicrobiales bacterium]